MKIIKPHHLILIAIILLSLFLRLFRIESSPPSLYWDEVSLGYDAYSILKTGKDFHGNPFPIVAFESFGDYKPSGYFYSLVPFIYLFGLSNLSVRLPSIIAGTLTVLLLYLIVKTLKGKTSLALLSSLILCVMPWHLQFSRGAFEVNLATFFVTLGTLMLIKSDKYSYLLIPSAISFVFSMYTYHSMRVLSPLLALALLLIFVKKWWLKPSSYISLIISAVLIWPLISAVKTPQITQRFSETSLFSTSNTVALTNKLRAEDGNTLISRLIHHRYLYWGKEILQNYAEYFNPGYLFVFGDGNTRHQSGLFGPLLYYQIPLLLIGLILLTTRKGELWRFLIIWWLLVLLPASLTNVSPHTLRSLPAAPAVAILLALGASYLIKKLNTNVLVIFILISLLNTLVYLYDYHYSYATRASQDWQYGYQQLFAYLKPLVRPSDKVYITRAYGRPSIYYLFYNQIDPRTLYQQNTPQDQGELLQVGNFYFQDIPNDLNYYISNTPLNGYTLLHTIPFKDNSIAFYVYQII